MGEIARQSSIAASESSCGLIRRGFAQGRQDSGSYIPFPGSDQKEPQGILAADDDSHTDARASGTSYHAMLLSRTNGLTIL